MSGTTPHARFGELRQLAMLCAIVFSSPLWLPLIGGDTALATSIVIWALFALGFNVLFGLMGYLSLGHAAFFGLAAYSTAWMLVNFGTDVLLAIGLAVGVTATVTLLMGFLLFRRAGVYFSILTLVFAEMFRRAALAVFDEGGEPLAELPTPTLFGIAMDDRMLFLLCAVILVVGVWVVSRLRQSPVGLMLRATRANAARLEASGINVPHYQLLALVISAIYAALAGGLMVLHQSAVSADVFGWQVSALVVMMVVIGGSGSMAGPIAGAFLVGCFEYLATPALQERWLLVIAVVFMLFVAFLPGGCAQLLRSMSNGLGRLGCAWTRGTNLGSHHLGGRNGPA